MVQNSGTPAAMLVLPVWGSYTTPGGSYTTPKSIEALEFDTYKSPEARGRSRGEDDGQRGGCATTSRLPAGAAAAAAAGAEPLVDR